MSLSASRVSVSHKRTVSSLLAGRVLKRPKQEDGRQLQEAAVQLLEQHQNLSSLFREAGNPDVSNIFHPQKSEEQKSSAGVSSGISGSMLACELRRQAAQLDIPVTVLSGKMVLQRLKEVAVETEEDREMLTSSQRAQLSGLMASCRELLSQGAFCPKLLWQEFKRDQKLPSLEVVYYLHYYSILTLKNLIESDDGVRSWLVPQLKALCGWMPPQEDEDTRQVQQRVLNTVAGILVGTGFDLDSAADRKISLLCCSMLDDMLFWVLDVVDTVQSAATGAKLWIQMFDASLCGVSASAEALQRFFTHSLTQVLTYKPRLTVSDAITLQNEWTFAKVDRLLTLLFRKLAVIFRVEQLLAHLQQVLETHEVNWKHVLCLLSTLLVYSQSGQPSLKDLLTRLLRSAFEGYDLENLITAFLLARQGALEGPCIFSSYSDWFKMSFGGGSGFHANSKKSLVFLLKFLSDLVPFEPPQYLKVHILHPPYVPVKHRSLLMEYVSLAKTRLSDLKESVEEMGLYEDVSGASVQPQCQAAQDVEKAVCLFESTGRISATVMEASIFRRPYFLTRFLPALLKPRVLPVKPDDRMSFIEALRKADKIPSMQYSSYVESCQKLMQHNKKDVSLDTNDDPLEVLKIQLQEFTELVVDGNDGEMSAQMSRISHTLSVVFPGSPDDLIGQKAVITLDSDAPLFPELHVKVVNMILRNFCQCLLNASRSNPPNRQQPWASRFVGMLLGNKQLLSSLIRRLWDLFHNQGRSLSAAHVLGLAAFLVHLHASSSQSPLVQLWPPSRPQPPGEALGSALPCNTSTNMLFTVRLCVAAVCYGICAGESLPQQQQQEFIPCSLYKKLLYLIPRLVPEARRAAADGRTAVHPEGKLADLWSSITDSATTWRKTAGQLWRHDAFQQLEQTPQFQLCFSEWLKNELRVRREEDALSDAQRQEYQQWVCSEVYLTRPEDRGGCGGDMTTLCSQLLGAVMDQQSSSDATQEEISCGTGAAGSGTCLPDVLSRLQELVYEMEATNLPGGGGHGRHLCDFLFDLASQRCCVATATSAPPSVGAELSLQHTVLAWNRVLLSLPAVSLIKVKPEGGRMTLDCNKLIEHVNQHQRKACSPAGLLSFHITAHFLKGLVCASVRCGRPGEEVNVVWSQMSVRCPLLLVSTARCWEHLSPLLSSLWRRLQDGDSLPEQLQLLTDCQLWACSLERGRALLTPPASALLLSASLHAAWRGCQGNQQSFGAALKSLRPEKDTKHRQVLVFLLFLCVNDYLSALLYPQEKSRGKAGAFCSELLTALASSPDWLLIFKPDEPSAYQSVTMVTSDECKRLLPFAFCSLIPQQSAELLQTLARAPGFLHAAVVCYGSVLQLFLEGRIPPPAAERSEEQLTAEPSQILSHTKRFLLSLISQTSPAALSSSQFRQLESLCADLDPELAAALSVNLDPHSLSPEMDFL